LTTPSTVTADPLAVLAAMRARALAEQEVAPRFEGYGPASAEDALTLLAGYDALLKLAAEFGGEVKALTAIGDDDYEPDTEDQPAWTARADAYRNAAIRIRSLIAAALSGEEVPSEH
jgi:hypothetical protein